MIDFGSNGNVKFILVMIWILICLGVLYSLVFPYGITVAPVETSPRMIARGTLTILPLWAQRLPVPADGYGTRLIAQDDVIVAAKPFGRVAAFDASAGRQVWSVDGIDPIDGLVADPVAQRVYVNAANSIAALSLRTGERHLIIESEHFTRSINQPQVRPNGSVIVYLDDDIRTLNLTHHAVGESLGLPGSVILTDLNIAIAQENNSTTLVASDTMTNEPVWQTDIGGYCCLDSVPYVEAGRLVFHTPAPGAPPQPVIVDTQTGVVIWQHEGEDAVVSNIEIAGGVGYALTDAAQLVTFDARTGSLLDRVSFQAPARNADLTGSWVAVDDETLAVYFQDTNTLAVYRLDQS